MFFHRKSKAHLPHISLYQNDVPLYEGLLKDIPIRENVLIEKSIHFFDDPEPCDIHRTAVRVRLTEELQKDLPEVSMEQGCLLLNAVCDVPEIDRYALDKPEATDL